MLAGGLSHAMHGPGILADSVDVGSVNTADALDPACVDGEPLISWQVFVTPEALSEIDEREMILTTKALDSSKRSN